MTEQIHEHKTDSGSVPFSAGFPGERMRWPDFVLALVAVIPIFVNLWLVQAWGSEHRWLDISAGILASGNWLEPKLEGQFYGDKPLLSYWAIVLAAKAAGHLNEGISRLPSALAGVLAVLATAWMAARLLGRRAAAPAAWILATAFSFFLWSRMASADLLNLFFLTAAVAVYVEGVVRFRPWKTILFFLLLALGGQAKGMPAVLIPLGIAGLDSILFRRALLLRQAGWIMLGMVLGAGLFFLPFLLSRMDCGSWRLLQLLWKENFVRGFNAFDHKANVAYYFYILPAMFVPWSIFLPGALGWAGKQFKSHAGWRFCLMSFALIFLFFTASESRRSYYILPVFPFCAMLVAGFLSDLVSLERSGIPVARTWCLLALVPVYILGMALALGLVFLVICHFLAGPGLVGMVGEAARAIPLAGLLVLGLTACLALLGAGFLRRSLAWHFAACSLVALLGVAYYAAGIEPLRAAGLVERAFAHEIGQKYPGAELVYYRGGNSTSRFYIGPGIKVDSNQELLVLLNGGRDSVLVVCEGDDLNALMEFQPVISTELIKAVAPGFASVVKPNTKYLLLKCVREAVAG